MQPEKSMSTRWLNLAVLTVALGAGAAIAHAQTASSCLSATSCQGTYGSCTGQANQQGYCLCQISFNGYITTDSKCNR